MTANPFRPSGSSSSRSFLDYFRCPPQFARFQTSNESIFKPGFFRLGEAVCFGHVPDALASSSPRANLNDALPVIHLSESGEICLPFDAGEVVSNLRLERYAKPTASELLLHTYYYLLRPILPFVIRKRLQRWVARSRRASSFPAWPVDCSVDLVFAKLMSFAVQAAGTNEVPFIWFWPDGCDSALTMTHDVESQKGADQCDFLMRLDDAYDMKAAFQLIPEGAYQDFDRLVTDIRARGFEVNIHDLDHDGRLYEHKELFQERVRKINAYGRKYASEGFRAGSMHRNQEWFDMLAFQYDMSVPTVSYLEPQNGGCCTVTPYFVGEVLELPLTTIQDHGMFYILGERSIELWKKQIEMILAHYGLISFIVHPDYVTRREECLQYRALLDHISHLRKSRSIWVALPGEINCWWRERSRMELVRDGHCWQVRGQGSERARIAFASVRNGVLHYRLAHREQNNGAQHGSSTHECIATHTSISGSDVETVGKTDA